MLHNTPTIPMESITGPSAGFLDKTHPSISDQWILQPEAVRTFPTIAFKTPSSCQRNCQRTYWPGLGKLPLGSNLVTVRIVPLCNVMEVIEVTPQK